jgi:hypothetical protein
MRSLEFRNVTGAWRDAARKAPCPVPAYFLVQLVPVGATPVS